MTYDMHAWICNPNWRTSYLQGKNQAGAAVIQHCYDTGNNIVYTKTDIRYPWDVKGYDSDFIYDWITELDWTSAKDYKAFARRVAMCPRYWSGDTSWHLHHGIQTVNFYKDCVLTSTGSVVPDYTLTGPFAYNFGGMVGTVNTIRINYQWSPVDMEYLHTTLQYGWVRWSHLTLANGVWTEDQWSLHNEVVVGTLTPDFGCFAIP